MRNIPDKGKPFWTCGKAAPNSYGDVKKPSGEPEDGTSEGCRNKEVGRAVPEHPAGDRHWRGIVQDRTGVPLVSLLLVDIQNEWKNRDCPSILTAEARHSKQRIEAYVPPFVTSR